MNNTRCFNCEKSLFRDHQGNVHHHRHCAFRKIPISGDALFKPRSCRFFTIRHERVLVKMMPAEKKISV